MSKCFVGVDVGKYKSFVVGIDDKGSVLFENELATSLRDFTDFFESNNVSPTLIAMEAGPISRPLCLGFCRDGYNAVSIDARHAAPIMRAIKKQKTDKNDAYAIAELARINGHRCVWVKSAHSNDRLYTLHFRNNLLKIEVDLKNSLSSYLASYGEMVKPGQRSNYTQKFDKYFCSETYSSESQQVYDLLKCVSEEVRILDNKIQTYASQSDVCSLLMTMPGVGPLTSTWFEAIIDDPRRFHNSRDVGAFLGLAPTVRQSGSIRRMGKISKSGSPELRKNLYLAARSALYAVESSSNLKNWAIRIKEKKGGKVAIVALARKMSVIMHAMWVSGKPFADNA